MPHLILQGNDVEPHFDQVRGIGVPQGMHANPLFNARFRKGRAQGMAYSFAADLLAAYFSVEKSLFGVRSVQITRDAP